MRRVVRLTGLVGGVLLLVITLGLAIARRQSPEPTMLVTYSPTPFENYLAWFVPGMSVPRILIEGESPFLLMDIPPDGEWFYVEGNSVNIFSTVAHYTDYRVNLRRGQVQAIADMVLDNTLQWTPDKKWLIYYRMDTNADTEQIIRLRPDGSERLDLSADLPDGLQPFSEYTSGEGGPVLVSPDSSYVLFSAGDSNYPPEETNIYRAWLEDGRLENLTADLRLTSYYIGSDEAFDPPTVATHFWPSGEELFIAKIWWELYWMRPDGSEAWRLSENQPGYNGISTWLPDEKILVVLGNPLIGLHPDQTTPLWQVNGWGNYWLTQDWLIFVDLEGLIWRMRYEGSDKTLVGDSSQWEYFHTGMRISGDEEWLVFQDRLEDSGNSNDWGAYRLNIMTGELEHLTAIGTQFELGGWSPDGKWFVYNKWVQGRGMYRMNWSNGETEQLLEFSGDGVGVRFMGYRPPFDYSRSMPLLFFTAIGLLSSARLLQRRG